MTQEDILLVISKFPPEYSGPGVRLPKFYDWLKKQEFEYNLQIVCNGIEYTRNENYKYNGFKVRRITGKFLNNFFSFLRFVPKKISHFIIYQYEFLKTFLILLLSSSYQNTQLLHVVGHSGGTAASLLWARFKRIPVLLELVNADAKPYQKFFNLFEIKAPRNSVVAYLTKFSANQHCIYDDAGPVQWIKPNPIDVQKFYFDEKNCPQKLRLTSFRDGDFLLLSVAKFMPRKNQIFLINVLTYLPFNYKLILAGPKISQGPNYARDHKYLQQMKDLILEKKLEERVLLIEEYVESSTYMKISDLYLMPAWGEGLGTPMLEAMACGLPVVGNKEESAFQEWICEGENGHLAALDNAEEWAQKIISLSKLSKADQQKISDDVSQRVSHNIIYDQYLEHIERLLKI